jgi:hypothetical protein
MEGMPREGDRGGYNSGFWTGMAAGFSKEVMSSHYNQGAS